VIAVDADDRDEVARAKEFFKNEGANDITTSPLSKAPKAEREEVSTNETH
jgi:hypothetical protein